MKKLLYLLALVFALTGCQKDEPKPETKKFEIDMTSKVYIKPDKLTPKTAQRATSENPAHLSDLDIVRKGNALRFFNDKLGANDWVAGFAGKDTLSETPAFLRNARDILALDGFDRPIVVPDFLYAYDCVIEIIENNRIMDTIAYIPNINMRTSEAQILQALADKDTTAVYSIFNNAFKFLPITGAEYRELIKQNLQ
jgi:hypothetical protein